jgi:hypothetical protein
MLFKISTILALCAMAVGINRLNDEFSELNKKYADALVEYHNKTLPNFIPEGLDLDKWIREIGTDIYDLIYRNSKERKIPTL